MANNFSQVPSGWGVDRGQLIMDGDTLQAPDNIIQNVTGARTLYYKWRFENFKRVELYSRIEGLIAGNPPYNPIDLDKQGLSHIANFNNLEARSLYEKSSLAYWNLLNSAEYLIDIDLRSSDPKTLEWKYTMCRHWTDVVREWPSFYTHVCTLSGQLIKFGVSPIIFSDERDWRWRTIELSRFYVSDQAPTDMDLITGVALETNFTAQYLYEVYDAIKDKPKGSTPWDAEELEGLLLYRANMFSKQDNQIIDMMDLQKRLQNGDLGWDVIFSDEIRLVTMLYKEYDGKITHYIFDRTYNKSNEIGRFLFKADRQYKNFQEALVIFTASPGEFTIHSNRGVGHKIFAGCQATMQIDCDIVNMTRLGSTPFIKTIAGLKDFEPIRVIPGVVTNIGAAEFAQNNLASNVQQLVGASQYLKQNIQYNIAMSGDDPAYPDASQGSISGTEAKIESYKEFGVLKHYVAHFYSQMDVVIFNMFIKMLNSKKTDPGYESAKEWKDRCLIDGVPEQFFALAPKDYRGLPRQFRSVKATRVAGNGSTLARIMGLQIIAPIVPSLDARGLKNYKKELVMAGLGPDHLSSFIGPEEPDEMAGGASLAGVENAVIQLGKSPIFSPDNEHRAHIVTHLTLGNFLIESIQQQQLDLIEADKMFSVLVPHLAEHMQFIAQDPLQEPFFKQNEGPFNQLAQYATLNKKNAGAQLKAQIRKQQELEAENQRVLSEEELKNLQVQSGEARKNVESQEKMRRAREMSENKTEISREKIEKDAANQRLKIQLDAQVKKQDNTEKSLPELRQDLAAMNGQTMAPFDIEYER